MKLVDFNISYEHQMLNVFSPPFFPSFRFCLVFTDLHSSITGVSSLGTACSIFNIYILQFTFMLFLPSPMKMPIISWAAEISWQASPFTILLWIQACRLMTLPHICAHINEVKKWSRIMRKLNLSGSCKNERL